MLPSAGLGAPCLRFFKSSREYPLSGDQSISEDLLALSS